MFIDTAKIYVKAGTGGNGAVTFHREKYVANGGPDGGDGGRGGDIIFVADSNLSTLADFRYKRKYRAQDGASGGANKCTGKSGENTVIKVPLGTVVKDEETGRIIADLSDETPVTIAKGGRGGWGNTHFKSSTRQIPRFSKAGTPGEERNLISNSNCLRMSVCSATRMSVNPHSFRLYPRRSRKSQTIISPHSPPF